MQLVLLCDKCECCAAFRKAFRNSPRTAHVGVHLACESECLDDLKKHMRCQDEYVVSCNKFCCATMCAGCAAFPEVLCNPSRTARMGVHLACELECQDLQIACEDRYALAKTSMLLDATSFAVRRCVQAALPSPRLSATRQERHAWVCISLVSWNAWMA